MHFYSIDSFIPQLYFGAHSFSLLKTQPKHNRPVAGCYRFVTCRQIATSLSSMSPIFDQSIKIRLVATRHLQTCYNLLKQLAASLQITSFKNQFVTILLTTCNRLVKVKLSQAMRTRLNIDLLITNIVARCQQTCSNLRILAMWVYIYY